MELKQEFEYFLEQKEIKINEQERYSVFAVELLSQLNQGKIRVAEQIDGVWHTNTWIKEAILLLFKFGKLTDYSIDNNFRYYDKDTIPLRPIFKEENIRIVPGGSSVRSGSYIAKGVIVMPPAYINIGAYIDEGTMVDSHALVGSCAQLGKNIHLSAASQIGGVLEPANALPVIIEDNVMIGGNCGIYEGVIVRKGAVLGSGVIITSSMKIFDIVNDDIIQKEEGKTLEIPENAVVVAGSRILNSDFAKTNGLSLYTPIIIKYRDKSTSAKTALNEILRIK
jgi:2,3,4,5-tetrahydropyridine-2-carboxylate N-succinyltransferase